MDISINGEPFGWQAHNVETHWLILRAIQDALHFGAVRSAGFNLQTGTLVLSLSTRLGTAARDIEQALESERQATA